MQQNVLIVDDNPDILSFLERLIEGELDVRVLTAKDARKALELLGENNICLIVADVRMPGMDGIELLKETKKINENIGFIMMTAYGTVETAVESLKLGAYDFITKPFDEERFLHTIKNFLERQRLLERTLSLEKRLREKEELSSLIGESPPMKKVKDAIKMVAKTDVTVLITGETGTGKELAARIIHGLSSRSSGPFITVNCPTIPEAILESELFGYKKGAFTSAMQDRKGLFEVADQGTIFLDEIGDIPQSVQTKLLRVLQEKEIKPLGETYTKKVDVRVIASTNQNLPEKIKNGQFREDLFYRLNVVSIRMPSLRELREDIILLARHFLKTYTHELGTPEKTLSDEATKLLILRTWKGNVRELQNAIRRALVFSKGNVITPKDFTSDELSCIEAEIEKVTHLPYKTAKDKVLNAFNKRYITELLKQTEGNVTMAAQRAGIERQSLQYLMKRYGITSQAFKPPAKEN
jgi:DNA-binding NtrC family response regulator